MSDHPERRRRVSRSSAARRISRNGRSARHIQGQALVEYALIAVLVCIAIAAVITATGPTIGNIFSNTVYNLLGQKFNTTPTLSKTEIFDYATQLSQFTVPPPAYHTNTPLSPTCYPAQTMTWSPTLTSPGAEGTWVYPCP